MSKHLPEPVADAVYWLNASGRSMVADALALWAESRKPIKLDFEQRHEAEKLIESAVDENVLRELVYELVSLRAPR